MISDTQLITRDVEHSYCLNMINFCLSVCKTQHKTLKGQASDATRGIFREPQAAAWRSTSTCKRAGSVLCCVQNLPGNHMRDVLLRKCHFQFLLQLSKVCWSSVNNTVVGVHTEYLHPSDELLNITGFKEL